MKFNNFSIFTAFMIFGLLVLGVFAFSHYAHAETLSVSFSATPQTIDKGGQATLKWNSEDAVECIIIGDGIKKVKLGSGILVVSPTQTTIYTISCRGKDATFIPAQDEVKVTVRDTSDVSSSDNDDSGSSSGLASTGGVSSDDSSFRAGCVANPKRASKNELIVFSATSAGGEGFLDYQWTGDVDGNGEEISQTFNTSGTKRAELTVTDSRGFTIETSCSAFIEQEQTTKTASSGTVTQTPPPSSSGSGAQTQSNTTASETAQTTNETTNNESLTASASQGSKGSLLFIFIFSIIVNMGALFYFFIYAKKKKEEKERMMEEEATLATS